MSSSQCPRCLLYFSRPQRLKSHLKRKNKCQIVNNEYSLELELSIINDDSVDDNEEEDKHQKQHICPQCNVNFTRKFNLDRHQQYYCRSKKDEPLLMLDAIRGQLQKNALIKVSSTEDHQLISTLSEKIKELERRLEDNYTELKEKPSNVHNNILQVVCVGSNQNYLDMLTEEFGDYDRALNFIKECALSHLTGDCKLIQRIYFQNSGEAPIKYLDRSRNKLEYVDENKKKIIDYKGQKLGRILANNLQNSYLKGVNYLINQNLDNNKCPNKFLDEYDVQSWNNHIYELSDAKYQRKIINSLDIPLYV